MEYILRPPLNILRPHLRGSNERLAKAPVYIDPLTYPHRHLSELHWHDYTQIWYIVSGTYIHTINGKNVVQNPGSVAIVFPYSTHQIDRTLSASSETKGVVLSISPEGFEKYALPFVSLSYNCALYNNIPLNNFVTFRGEEKLRADKLLYGILTDIYNHNPPALTNVFSRLADFLELCTNNSVSELPKHKFITAKDHAECINRSIDFIHRNFCENISLDNARREAMMSSRLFSKAFPEIIGKTFHKTLFDFRLAHAIDHLRYNDNAFYEIADICQFAHQSHFSNTCKSMFNKSPSDLREYLQDYQRDYRSWDEQRKKEIELLSVWDNE